MTWMDGPDEEGPRPPRKGPMGGVMIREPCPDCENGKVYSVIFEAWVDCETCDGTSEIETEDCKEWDD